MNFPRFANQLEGAQWTFCSQGRCATCNAAIEWWKDSPTSQRRAYDRMTCARSPVMPHRCYSHGQPSAESLRRHAVRGFHW